MYEVTVEFSNGEKVEFVRETFKKAQLTASKIVKNYSVEGEKEVVSCDIRKIAGIVGAINPYLEKYVRLMEKGR